MRSFPCSPTLGSVLIFSLGSLCTAAEQAASAGDPSHGRTLFQQNCALCHATGTGAAGEAGGGLGPSLAGVVGRPAASVPNFGYTKALSESGLTWDAATLNRYLENPPAAVPGTSMPMPVPSAQDRADLIAFMATLTGSAVASSAASGAPSPTADANDWRHDAPGVKHHLTVADLPAPFSTSSAGNSPKVVPRPDGAELSVPAGFKVRPFATGLSGPRLLRVAPNGDIFIAETNAKRVRVLRATDGAEAPSQNEVFAEGVDRPFGIAFYPAGEDPQWVYVAENNAVMRFPYRKGDLKARGAAQVVVPTLSKTTGGHTTRDLAFSKDGKRLFISVGSASNYTQDIGKKTPEEIQAWEAEHGWGTPWGAEANRALILVTDPEGRAPAKVFASGIRNPVGLAVNATTGDLWASTNERDGLGDNLVPDYITRVKEGGYYGWPWYYLGNYEEPRLAGHRPDLAGKAIVPDVLIQAHSAALQITFYTATSGSAVFPTEYRGDLFAALHGSWNRNSRTGYKVVRVPLKAGVPTGEYEDFLTGFVVDSGSVWGRPVGVAVARDGALLVTEDGNGTLWRISPGEQ